MKKAKVLALVLTVALMLSGIGYALWSDSIVLTSTAETGFIKVDFVDTRPNCNDWPIRADAEVDELTVMNNGDVYKNYLKHDPEDAATDPVDDWNDAEFTDEGIYFTVEKIYPNAQYELKYTVQNNGTVPVIFKGQEVEFVEGDWALFMELKDKISTPGRNVEILDLGETTELVTSFKVPNWTGHQNENQGCTIKITLKWEQVAVKLESSIDPAV